MDTQPKDRPRVLIVDDQKNWRETLRDTLEDSDRYEIETATTYDEAKRKLKERAFHVLVSDQRLVDANEDNIQGILLLDELSELKDGAQAIIVTAYPTVEAIKKALKGRDAYDYILKRPEEGGSFNIQQYRQRVNEAAQKAVEARKKSITIGFSPSAIVTGLTYERITEFLFPGKATFDAAESVRKVLNRLLYPFQPLARGMGRVRLSEADRTCEVLCWSREQSKAVSIEVGIEQSLLEMGKVKWFDKNRYEIEKRERFEAGSVVGVSYTIDGMTFEDFAKQVEED